MKDSGRECRRCDAGPGGESKLVFVRNHFDAGAEFERLKVIPVLAKRFEAGVAQRVGDKFGSEFRALGPAQPAFERVGSQIANLTPQICDANFRGVTADVRWRRLFVCLDPWAFLQARYRQHAGACATFRR